MIRKPGNALLEYGAIGALITVACILTLMVVGTDLTAWLEDLRSDLLSQSDSARGNQPATPSGPVRRVNQYDVLVSGREQVCFQRNYCVNLPVVNGGNIVTSGGNGGEMTREFSNVLLQLAEQIEADPDGDDALAAMIRRLANQGHGLADYQLNNLAQGYYADANWDESNHGRMNPYHQQRYENQVRDKIHVLQQELKPQFESQYQQVMDYMKRHPRSLPYEARKLVDLESRQIMRIVGGYSTDQIEVSSQLTGRAYNHVGITSNFNTQAELTHQSADTVCRAGAHANGCMRNN